MVMQKSAAGTENTEIPGKPTLRRDWSVSAIAAGFLAVLISYSGPAVIFFQAADVAHVSGEMVASWIWGADSSSITNTLRISCRDGVGGLVHQRGEHLIGCRKAKRLARPAVEPGGDGVEFGFRENRQGSALGEVLAQQAISVLVGAALPRRMRVGEVNAQARERGQLAMAGHLLALVVGQGEAQRGRHRQQAGGEAIARRLGFGVGQLDQDHLTAGPLDQRADRGTIAGPLDQIALPMSGHQASLSLRWPFVDAGHVADPAPPFAVLGPSAALWLALAQAGEQLAPQFTARHGVDRLVDRFVRHS